MTGQDSVRRRKQGRDRYGRTRTRLARSEMKGSDRQTWRDKSRFWPREVGREVTGRDEADEVGHGPARQENDRHGAGRLGRTRQTWPGWARQRRIREGGTWNFPAW